jgi:hypothetical protein
VSRQHDNDDLWRSIRRADRATAVLGAMSVACLVAAATRPLWPGERIQLRGSRGELHLALGFDWP